MINVQAGLLPPEKMLEITLRKKEKEFGLDNLGRYNVPGNCELHLIVNYLYTIV